VPEAEAYAARPCQKRSRDYPAAASDLAAARIATAVRLRSVWGARLGWVVIVVGAGFGCASHTSTTSDSLSRATNHSSAGPSTSVAAPTTQTQSADPSVVAAIGAKLLQPDDVGLAGVVSWDGPLPWPVFDPLAACTGPNPQVPASAQVETGGTPDRAAHEQGKVGFGFFETVLLYNDEATAGRALDAETASIVRCVETQSANNATPPSEPKDVSSAIGAAQAVEIDYGEPDSQVFIVRAGDEVIEFKFLRGPGEDPAPFPDPTAVVRAGVQRLSS